MLDAGSTAAEALAHMTPLPEAHWAYALAELLARGIEFAGVAVIVLGVAVSLLLVAKLIDWRNRWSPA